MKRLLFALIACFFIAFSDTQAQEIANIEVTSSWYYVYDANGKKIATMTTYNGELMGYSSQFFILKSGSWYYLYSPTGKKLKTLSVSYVGDIIGVAGSTFTSRNGSWIYTWSIDGKKLNTRAAR